MWIKTIDDYGRFNGLLDISKIYNFSCESIPERKIFLIAAYGDDLYFDIGIFADKKSAIFYLETLLKIINTFDYSGLKNLNNMDFTETEKYIQ